MIVWLDSLKVYLHIKPVDFRKSINGLSVIVSDDMGLSPFDQALFVFCNKRRSQLKALYWDKTGFALWQKRLEKEKFKWPRDSKFSAEVISHEQWQWLLRGFDITKIKPHQMLKFESVC